MAGTFNLTEYESSVKPIFCPGCGDFGVRAALLKAMHDLQLDPSSTVVVSGIGCSSSMPHTLKTYGIHGIHGRLLPIAEGLKLANKDLTVIGTGGDGDGYGIGISHLIHAARRNIDITYIVMNNQIYGLTTGQASPTSLFGHKTKSTPFGVIEEPINPIAISIIAGATYVARGFSGDPTHLAALIEGGIRHRGFAIIDVLSPCVTFNHLNTYDWFRQRVYKIESSHDPADKGKALALALEFDNQHTEKIPIGLFYEESRPLYNELDEALKIDNISKMAAPTAGEVEAVLAENRISHHVYEEGEHPIYKPS
ncbi:MAG: thiamine pyrophosphate-dependent enzyme [Candidatus Micrarchaeaceae archaeon]